MYAKIGFTIEQDGVTLNVYARRQEASEDGPYYSFPSHSFTIPNEEIAGLLKHVVGLAKKPKAAPKAKAKGVVTPSYFDAFWDLYPHTRRVARAQMQVKWAANHLDAEWPLIERHLRDSMPGWAKDQYRFCPLVTTYVNQRRWEAIAEEVQPTIV